MTLVLTAFLLLALLLLNVFAFIHARAMTHFVGGGQCTPPPEELSRLRKARVLLTGVRIPRPANRLLPDALGLPFQTHQFPSTDGTPIECWHIPAAAATAAESPGVCIVFHSYAASKSEMLPEAQGLYARGYDVMLVDFRGCGGSGGDVTTIGYREADDVAAAVAYVRSMFPDRRLILYGQSMGSAAVLRAVATRRVRPDAIIIECPFDRLLSTAGNRFRSMGLPVFPLAHLLVFWGGIQHGYGGLSHNPADYAKRVDCPVLMLHGRRDPRVTPEQARSIFENLSGSKRFVAFRSLGHECIVRAEPERWAEIVGEFLASATSKCLAPASPAAGLQDTIRVEAANDDHRD